MQLSIKAKEAITNAWASQQASVLDVYSGSIPADKEVSTLTGKLVSLSQNGSTTVTGGVASMPDWSGVATATGTAGFAVFDNSVAIGGRIYFTVGVAGSGADLIISSTSITSGDNITGNVTITVVP